MEELERIPRLNYGGQTKNTRTSGRPFRVCIIGAGLAGLSAAETLTLHNNSNDDHVNFEVRIFEAMERPGGRAVTVSFAGGIVEGGAQFIHGCDGNPVYHRARKHKLKLISCTDFTNRHSIRQRDGRSVPESLLFEVSELYNKVLIKTQAKVHHEERVGCGDQTVGAFMKRHFEKYFRMASGSPRDKVIKANILRHFTINECCYSACNDLGDLQLQDFGEYKELMGNVRFAAGYNKFLDTFLKNLPSGTIVYNKPVQQIDWSWNKTGSDSPITITSLDGDQYEADCVIVTTSLGYLKEHAATMFTPSLPTRKLDLIARMGFGTAGKIWLEYAEPFWVKSWGGLCPLWDMQPDEIMKDTFREEEWLKYITNIGPVSNNPRLLMVWTCGKAAEYIETLDNDYIAQSLTGILCQFLRNPTIPTPVRVLKTGWHSNPYVRGSYSYVAAGSAGADIDSLAEPLCIASDDGRSQPLICFAGEATHRTFYSTTHGAMLSGQREAERIISHVRLGAEVMRTSELDRVSISK